MKIPQVFTLILNISYLYIRIKEEKSPITIDYQRLFFFFSDPPGIYVMILCDFC